MAGSTTTRNKLSEDILAALQRAQELQEHEVAERLLQTLEILAQGDINDEALRSAYLAIPLTAAKHSKGLHEQCRAITL